MRQRTHSVLVVVMMLLLFAASSQAAVCELSCALKMQTGACQMAAMPITVAVMNMSAADCPAMQGPSVSSDRSAQGICSHPLVLAVEKNGCVGDSAVAPQWTVVAVLPLKTTLAPQSHKAGKAPPLRPAAIDPVFLSFRI